MCAVVVDVQMPDNAVIQKSLFPILWLFRFRFRSRTLAILWWFRVKARTLPKIGNSLLDSSLWLLHMRKATKTVLL